jgi:hypothetical protein
MSEKYSFASLEVEVPKPVKQHDMMNHEMQRSNVTKARHYISVCEYHTYCKYNINPLQNYKFS